MYKTIYTRANVEMNCLVFMIATLFVCDVRSVPDIEGRIKDYYKSESIKSFKKAWELHRRPMQHAIKTALTETAGLPGMNVYVRKVPQKIAVGYIHDDNHVKVIFSNLYLKGMPRCRMPDLNFQLSSNVIKIETDLSEMIIYADYSLARDTNHIIHETQNQDPFKYSPFLFAQVDDIGKVAIKVDRCTLSGFIITTLGADSVNLGYDYFRLTNCVYSIEIHNKRDQSSQPVIAKYNLDRKDDTELGLTDLLLRPLLTDELMPKIQGAIFSFVNTSAIFGTEVTSYKVKQKKIFQETEQYMISVTRLLNKKTVNKNKGFFDIEDFSLMLDNGNVVSLTGMELFGVDTIYLGHSGGPVWMGKVMIAEEIRLSSLQVRGSLQATSDGSETSMDFAAEIRDLVLDVHMDEAHWSEGFQLLEFKGLSRMIITLSSHTSLHSTHASEESLISGYLLKEVPKLIYQHLSEIYRSVVDTKNSETH